MNKRFNALAMSLLIFFSTVIPSRNANALGPLALGLAFVDTAGAVMASEALLSAGTAILGGMAIAAILITPGDSSQNSLRIPLTSAPSITNSAIPAPAASGSVAAQEQSPASRCGELLAQSTVRSQPAWCFVTTTFTSNGSSSYGGGYYSCGYNRKVTGDPGCEAYNSETPNDGAIQVYQANPSVTCPAGYTSGSGGSCTLVNARVAVPDSKHDVVRTSTGFSSSSSSDVDAVPPYAAVGSSGGASGSAPPAMGSAGAAPGKVYVSGKDSSGRPIAVEYAVSPDGTKTYVTHYTQTDVGGQSVVNTQAITLDAATGQVVGSSASAAQGSISGAGSASVPVVETGASVAPSSTSTNTSPIVFPTDYARAGEAAQASTSINSKIETTGKSITDSIENSYKIDNAVSPDDPALPETAEFTDGFFKDTFSPLLSWQLPAHSSACPTPDLSFTVFGSYNHLILDSHCTIFESVKGTLSTVMIAVWLIVAMFIVLGA